MAEAAVGGEPGRRVIRIGCPVEVLSVAGEASRRCARINVVNVTLRAGYVGMQAYQRITRVERVVEGGIRPVDRAVALAAVPRQTKRHVVRVRGAGKVRRMTRIAGGGCPFELVVDMARRTRQRRMRSRECEAGVLQVVEIRAQPRVCGVAGLAVS